MGHTHLRFRDRVVMFNDVAIFTAALLLIETAASWEAGDAEEGAAVAELRDECRQVIESGGPGVCVLGFDRILTTDGRVRAARRLLEAAIVTARSHEPEIPREWLNNRWLSSGGDEYSLYLGGTDPEAAARTLGMFLEMLA